MSGIYIHIPFCRQACSYCDFHFSTNTSKMEAMVNALIAEIRMRKDENVEKVETIYFGGGTPSMLSTYDINRILDSVYENWEVDSKPEITLEANPDDLTSDKIKALAQSRINRLSIGIQSFFEEDLRLMNRAHSARQSHECLKEATLYFDNITLDLIYGVPGMTDEKWKYNIQTALHFGIPHLSAYALTVEPKTALDKWIDQGKVKLPKDEAAEGHFKLLREILAQNDFVHYEISNFAKSGYYSRNNSAYWLGKKYLGIGPSAHSFDGKSRSWNLANNALYIKTIESGELPSEKEELSVENRFNELVMTGLRTIWGISISQVESEFGCAVKDRLLTEAARFISQGFLALEDDKLRTTESGKFLADGIASDLFLTE